MIAVQVTPEPSITTVWTGIRAVGGKTIAMIPSKITPPAAPVKTPIKAVAKEAAERRMKISGPTSGLAKKSILPLWKAHGTDKRHNRGSASSPSAEMNGGHVASALATPHDGLLIHRSANRGT